MLAGRCVPGHVQALCFTCRRWCGKRPTNLQHTIEGQYHHELYVDSVLTFSLPYGCNNYSKLIVQTWCFSLPYQTRHHLIAQNNPLKQKKMHSAVRSTP